MAKLPPNVVKKPVFDSPMRATSSEKMTAPKVGRAMARNPDEIGVELPPAELAAFRRECEERGVDPGQLATRIIAEWVVTRDRPITWRTVGTDLFQQMLVVASTNRPWLKRFTRHFHA